MLAKVVVLFALISVVSAGCDKFPNGTDTTLNWFPSCPSKAVIYSVLATDANNNAEYPIHLGQPLYAHVNVTNNGAVYQRMNLTINIWSWGGWSGCDWHTLPTLNLLNNLDGCSYGLPCPLPLGNQMLALIIDFSQFQAIINLLQDDAPYQVQMVLEGDNGDQVCATVQARARIH